MPAPPGQVNRETEEAWQSISKDWKRQARVSQALENLAGKFPRLGNVGRILSQAAGKRWEKLPRFGNRVAHRAKLGWKSAAREAVL